jgi:Flp pilus assembly protein TadD
LLLRLEEVCECFEAAWQAAHDGVGPPIEDYLAKAPAGGLPALLRELVRIDLDYRRQARQAPAAEEYLDRFPDLDREWLAGLLAAPAGATWRPASDRGAADPPTRIGPPMREALCRFPLPARLGDYELLKELGRGGMGIVYQARHLKLNRLVALKMILSGAYAGEIDRARFRTEAETIARLQHPNIVQIHDVGEFDGLPYFSLEFCPGGSLDRKLAGTPLSSPEAALLVETLARAMQVAHDKGTIHRDLKPANVLLATDGTPKVTDFGLARGLDTAGQTATGALLGTPSYMAPEQADGSGRRVGPLADVYALGAILYECLTGRAPFRGPTALETLKQVVADEPVPPRRLQPRVPRDLEIICLKCLQKEPAGRYASAAALADDLRRWQAGEPIQARPVGRGERALKWVRRNPVSAALLAVLLLTVVAGGGGLGWARQRRQATDAAVTGLASEAERLKAQGGNAPWAEAPRLYALARDTAGRADELARTGGASVAVKERAAALARSLEEEAAAAERDRRLLVALMEVRRPSEGRRLPANLAEPSLEEQFAAAFRAWEPTFDVDVLPTAEAAARLKRRPPAVVTEVIVFLDQWVAERRRQGDSAAPWQHVADLVAALDEPGSRRGELRALLAGGLLGREAALGLLSAALRPVPIPFDAGVGKDRARLRQLAAATDPVSEPSLGLVILAWALREAGEDDQAERLLRAALRARPGEFVLYVSLGWLLVGQQPPRWREAAECYAAARALRPELGDPLAYALVKSNQAEAGLALYDWLVKEQPDNPWLHFRRGNALHERRHFREAEAAFREAVRLNPDFAEAHANLGNALNQQRGRSEEAEAAFREALRLKSGLPTAHKNLGVVLNQQGRHEEAEAELRKALNLKPDFAEAHSNLGIALHRQGRPEEAEVELREALRLKPDYPEAHNNLGFALSCQGRHKEAETACREALRLKPDYATAHGNLGLALLGQGRFAEAREELRRGQALGSKFPAWWLLVGGWGLVKTLLH